MVTNNRSSQGVQVPYIEELEGWVLDERKVVTFRWLALVLSVTANIAKKMLYDFYERQGPGKVWATYLVVGRTGGGKDGAGSSLEVKLVPASSLDCTRKAFELVTSVHVYSVQAAPAMPPVDVSTQLWATDMEHCKEMVDESTDAGASLRTHRLSGVRCPSVADVPAPTASTPLQHVEEISPFARPAATSGAGRKASGNASSAPEKPKGKAIDPKDFFSVSASAGGEAGAKGAKGKGKGKGAEKPAPKKEGGGISSFFGKVSKVATSAQTSDDKGSVPANASVPGGSTSVNTAKATAKQAPDEKRDSGIDRKRRSMGIGAANRHEAEQEDGERSKESGESCASSNGHASGPRKNRLRMVIDDYDEDEEDGDNGHDADVGGDNQRNGLGRSAEDVANGGGKGHDGDGDGNDDEEVEWNDGSTSTKPSTNGKAAKAPEKASERRTSSAENGVGNGRTKGKAARALSTGGDDDGRDSVNGNSNGDGPAAKKAKVTRKTPKKATRESSKLDGEESDEDAESDSKMKKLARTGTSQASSENACDSDDTSKDVGARRKSGVKRGKQGGKSAGVKRKGRYDSDEEEDEQKEPVSKSGAMDKFATKNGIDQGGVRTKRTKTVLRKKTYMDEKGYMKMVNEEVEVTDDEEPAQPSQNKGRGPSTTEQSKIGDDRRESDAAAAEGRAEDDAEAEDKKGNKVGNKKSATKAGGGSKASAKKAAAAKLSKGKQSSMMSFFKKI